LPKNVQEIKAEVGQIYPVQIDAEWSGFDLQKIETSWLNFMNKEGSQPEKMTFVRFLVGEIMKKPVRKIELLQSMQFLLKLLKMRLSQVNSLTVKMDYSICCGEQEISIKIPRFLNGYYYS